MRENRDITHPLLFKVCDKQSLERVPETYTANKEVVLDVRKVKTVKGRRGGKEDIYKYTDFDR